MRDNEPAKDLNSELCSERPDAKVQVTVRVVEQERGLELQINAPESTLATTLAPVNANEAARALKIEDFSAKLDAIVHELLKDLKREVCSTNPEATVREAVRLFARLLI